MVVGEDHLAGRGGNVDMQTWQTNSTDFDYKVVNQVVYEYNGVIIR